MYRNFRTQNLNVLRSLNFYSPITLSIKNKPSVRNLSYCANYVVSGNNGVSNYYGGIFSQREQGKIPSFEFITTNTPSEFTKVVSPEFTISPDSVDEVTLVNSGAATPVVKPQKLSFKLSNNPIIDLPIIDTKASTTSVVTVTKETLIMLQQSTDLQCFVFDFDETITRKHLWHMCEGAYLGDGRNKAEPILKETDAFFIPDVFGSNLDNQIIYLAILGFLHRMGMRHGIATFNYSINVIHVIDRYFSYIDSHRSKLLEAAKDKRKTDSITDKLYIELELADLTKLRSTFNAKTVIGREEDPSKDPGKNGMLSLFGSEKHKIHLIDDDNKNIKLAESAGYSTMHIDNTERKIKGLNRYDFVTIQKKINCSIK